MRSCSAAVAAVLGVVLGIGIARLLEPFVQARSDLWFGPFEVPWLHLAGVAAFGLVSALLAAVVPAYLASRQDVVAVLAGRRGDQAPSLKSPAARAGPARRRHRRLRPRRDPPRAASC